MTLVVHPGAAGQVRLLALSKPAGLPVFPLHNDPSSDCVLARLVDSCPAQTGVEWPSGFAGGIAHRLDNSTSGQLLAVDAALSDDANAEFIPPLAALGDLRGRFASKQLKKRYLFVSGRQVPWRTHQVTLRLAHHRQKKSRMIVERGQNTPHRGRWLAAETEFVWVCALGGGRHVWEATMRTGVMHQIRAHAAFVGVPLLGDNAYGSARDRWPTGDVLPEAAEFLLHHVGIGGPDICVPECPVPLWWPHAEQLNSELGLEPSQLLG